MIIALLHVQILKISLDYSWKGSFNFHKSSWGANWITAALLKLCVLFLLFDAQENTEYKNHE